MRFSPTYVLSFHKEIQFTLAATSGLAMMQSAWEDVSLPRMSLVWSWVVPGSRVTAALMVARLMIHHSGTVGRRQATLVAPTSFNRLAAF